eukprot:1185452-Pleurochrysis_carterae.AAC.1
MVAAATAATVWAARASRAAADTAHPRTLPPFSLAAAQLRFPPQPRSKDSSRHRALPLPLSPSPPPTLLPPCL